jgi:hypothetical protein
VKGREIESLSDRPAAPCDSAKPHLRSEITSARSPSHRGSGKSPRASKASRLELAGEERSSSRHRRQGRPGTFQFSLRAPWKGRTEGRELLLSLRRKGARPFLPRREAEVSSRRRTGCHSSPWSQPKRTGGGTYRLTFSDGARPGPGPRRSLVTRVEPFPRRRSRGGNNGRTVLVRRRFFPAGDTPTVWPQDSLGS